jgi:hypothetical protein
MMLTAGYCMTALCVLPLNTARHVARCSRTPQELYALGAIAEAPAPHLPVTAAADQPVSPAAAAAAGLDAEDEVAVLSQEFHGHQLKHHMTAEELQQHRRH